MSLASPTARERSRVSHPAQDHCLAPSRGYEDGPAYGGRYDRLFPGLAPLESDPAQLVSLAAPGGPCDSAGRDADAAGAAGWPFFGQLVAHDITADRSPLMSLADVEAVHNFRAPRANLECVYGAGPVGSPFLFRRDDQAKLLVGINDQGRADDLPRNHEGLALIGDPRNDSHLFVSQVHVGLLRVHNGLVDRLRAEGVPERDLFEQAARATRWHYQWILVNEYLPAVAGADLVADVLDRGPRLYQPEFGAYIPLEFAHGAFRCSHGQIREHYRVNGLAAELSVFPDLIGFRPVTAARTVDWGLMFDLPGAAAAQRARRIDGKLAGALVRLPRQLAGEVDEQVDEEPHISLAGRDLARGRSLGLPSGEAVARAAGERPLSADELGLADAGWSGQTPLWLYLMREAAVRGDGDHLGPVGGRIVAEVLVGILDADPASYRSVDPGWAPTLASGGRFEIAELLAFAAASG